MLFRSQVCKLPRRAEPKMIRLDEKQYRAVKKMTRAACANNDCGNCLLLDDGETCVCVQSISYSLLCRYFREAVLPADRQLCEQITRSGKQSALVPVAARRFTRARKTTTVPTGLAALSCGKMTCSFSSAKRLSQRRLPPPF